MYAVGNVKRFFHTYPHIVPDKKAAEIAAKAIAISVNGLFSGGQVDELFAEFPEVGNRFEINCQEDPEQIRIGLEAIKQDRLIREPWRRYLAVSGLNDEYGDGDLYRAGLHAVRSTAYLNTPLDENGAEPPAALRRRIAAHTLILAVMWIPVKYPGSLQGVIDRVIPHARNMSRYFPDDPIWRYMPQYINGGFFNRGEDWIVNPEGVICGHKRILRDLVAMGLVTDVEKLASEQKQPAPSS